MSVDYISYIHAAIVVAGGIIGYVKAASTPSLIAGIAFGLILGYGAFLNSKEPPKPWISLIALIVLAGFMGYRWYNSGKIIPAGVVCLLSAAIFARNLYVYYNHLNLNNGFFY